MGWLKWGVTTYILVKNWEKLSQNHTLSGILLHEQDLSTIVISFWTKRDMYNNYGLHVTVVFVGKSILFENQ